MPHIIDVKCAQCGTPLHMEISLTSPVKPAGLPVRDELGRWFCPPDPMKNRNCRRDHARMVKERERGVR